MIIYNELGQVVINQMYLAYPNKKLIGKINNVKNYSPTFKFCSQGLDVINFKVHRELNGITNDIYNKLEVKMLIKIHGIGWFQIQECSENHEDDSTSKEITIISYANFLIGKRIEDINGVFALYDPTDPDNSILHLCAKYSGWAIGHVDNELISKFRTLSIDASDVYNLLTGDIAKSFNCLFRFDTVDETINAYLPEHLGNDTDIYITDRNLLKKYNRISSSDNIVTKMRVKGGTGSNGIQLDIRSINPDGSNTLINVDYYLPMMSDSLRSAWINYINKYNSQLTAFNNLISTLENRLQEKIILQSQLKDLEGQRDVQDEVVKSYIYTHGNVNSSTPNYQSYLDALNSYNSFVTQVANKNIELSNKDMEIKNLEHQISDLQTDLTSGNFSTNQLNELEMFLTEGDVYEDSTFTTTDTMTDKDILDMQLELRNNAFSELTMASKPQYEIKIEASNLFTIIHDPTKKLNYDKWKQKLEVGNFITVKINDYSSVTLRILEISLDYDAPDVMTLTLSNRSKSDVDELDKLLNNASNTSSIVSLNRYGYDQASKISSDVRNFMNSSLDATLNKIISNPNAEFEVTPYGAMMKQWDNAGKKYSDYQSMWSGYNLLFSSDGFKTAKTGIGLFVDPSNGFTYYGVLADVIVGQMILAESLSIVNQNNKIRLDKNGASFVDCDISITRGNGVLKLSAADGIKYTKNGVNQFYVNSSGDITFSGTLSGANGIFSGTVQAGTIIGGTIQGTNITGGSFTSTGYYDGILSKTQIKEGTIISVFGLIDYVSAKELSTSEYDGIRTYNTVIKGKSIRTSDLTCDTINGKPYSAGITLTDVDTHLSTASIYMQLARCYSSDRSLYANSAGNANELGGMVYVSANGNLRPYSSYGASSCGTSDGRWSSMWAINGTIQTSDKRLKHDIHELSKDTKFLNFIKMIIPYTYKMNEGTSGRKHVGFIAQEIEESMAKCNISDMDFAGLIKAPIHESKLENGEYDTTSKIIDYTYHLRYDEFIPLIVLWMQNIDKKIQLTIDSM